MKKTLLLLTLLAISGLVACDDDDDPTGPGPSTGLVGTWGRSSNEQGFGTVSERVVFKSDSSFVRSTVVASGGDSLSYYSGTWRARDSVLTVTSTRCKELSGQGVYSDVGCDEPEALKYILSGSTLKLIRQTAVPPDTLTFTRR